MQAHRNRKGQRGLRVCAQTFLFEVKIASDDIVSASHDTADDWA